MPNVEKLSIALTSKMAAFVRDAVEFGDHLSSAFKRIKDHNLYPIKIFFIASN